MFLAVKQEGVYCISVFTKVRTMAWTTEATQAEFTMKNTSYAHEGNKNTDKMSPLGE